MNSDLSQRISLVRMTLNNVKKAPNMRMKTGILTMISATFVAIATASRTADMVSIGVWNGNLTCDTLLSRRRLSMKLIKWVMEKLAKYPIMPYFGSNINSNRTSNAEVRIL